MIQIGIHKDILNDYEEKILGGLSIRKLVACAVAFPLGILVTLVLVFIWDVDATAAGYFAAAIAIPIWYLGFAKPKGLAPEKYIVLWFSDRFGEHRLIYKTEASDLHDVLAAERKEDAGKEKARRKPGDGCEWCGRPHGKSNQKLRRALWEEWQAIARARLETLREGAGKADQL